MEKESRCICVESDSFIQNPLASMCEHLPYAENITLSVRGRLKNKMGPAPVLKKLRIQ